MSEVKAIMMEQRNDEGGIPLRATAGLRSDPPGRRGHGEFMDVLYGLRKQLRVTSRRAESIMVLIPSFSPMSTGVAGES